ncbi:MAG: hypothetical protein EXR59_02575 [Dehalococcoidia bacterium]|nr:hypothetical protein [Dehalococcoidia bacterium]
MTFLIELGSTTGTCFAVLISPTKTKRKKSYIFATAYHVIEKLTRTSGPIKLVTANKSKAYEIMPDSYTIYRKGPKEFDTGIIEVSSKRALVSEKDLLPMLICEERLPRESEIAAVGFLGLADEKFCFFRGVIFGYSNPPPPRN